MMIQPLIVANFRADTKLRIYWCEAIDYGCRSHAVNPTLVSQNTTISNLLENRYEKVSH
jgi:hypothetical protein